MTGPLDRNTEGQFRQEDNSRPEAAVAAVQSTPMPEALRIIGEMQGGRAGAPNELGVLVGRTARLFRDVEVPAVKPE